MPRRTLALLVVAFGLIASILASNASAFHGTPIIYHYWSGSLTTDGEGVKTADCTWGIDANQAVWTTGAGAYGTSAIINTSGTWVASGRNQSGNIQVNIAPSIAYVKGLCKNSTPWQITVYFDCYMEERQSDTAQCV